MPTTCCAPAWPSRSACAFPATTFAAVDPLAIQWNADGAYVWVGVDGRAKQVPVRIVQRNNDAVLVDADLAAGHDGGDARACRCCARARRSASRATRAPATRGGEPARRGGPRRRGPEPWRRGRTSAARRRGFTALFVRRPILAVVLNSLIVIAGLAALFGVEVRELPDVDRPVITVTTDYDGAAPETDRPRGHQRHRGRDGAHLGGQRHLLALVLRAEPGDGGVHRRDRPQRRGVGRARFDRAGARTSCPTTPTSRGSSRPTPTPTR